MTTIISIEELQPGMVITRITEQNGPVRIRKSGLVTSPEMVIGLTEMGVKKLEIDQAQTVELEPKAVPKSQTQKLLEKDSGQSQVHHDKDISDQFNRSLFLPSVQGLPSAWQYYAKQTLQMLVVVVGGGLIGLTAANYQHWIPAQSTEESLVSAENSATVVKEAKNGSDAELVTAQPAAAKVKSELSNTAQQSTSTVDEQPPILSQEVEEVPVVMNSSIENDVDLSPELAERFQQAVNALNNTTPSQQDDGDNAPEDVARVDQLPGWILSELPSMSFSTHMYISEPADRWVRVNGKELGEGDWIDQDLRINRIDPQHVILLYKGHEFSMSALAEW